MFRFARCVVLTMCLACSPAFAAELEDLAPFLKPVLAKHDVPGLAAAVVVGTDLVAIGAVGVRQRGEAAALTTGDRFHLGSCTKAMTATLCAQFIERKQLDWKSTIGDVCGDFDGKLHADFRPVTLRQLLTNQGGAPNDIPPPLWRACWQHKGTAPAARELLVRGIVSEAPVAPPGMKFIYSNAGFSIAGHMLEKTTGKSWETLLTEELFRPLEMKSAGFGAPGTRDTIDQPRGHKTDGTPVLPGPEADNPAAIGPGGTVHATLADWARFVSLHLEGAQGRARLLSAKTFTELHTPPEGSDYACGWGTAQRGWGGGRVLTHTGSNTYWFAVTWLAPKRNFAVLVCCNQGGDVAAQATDDVAGALVTHYSKRPPAARK